MFEVLYRITERNEDLVLWNESTFKEGGDISGFFALNVNGYHHGHYHNYPLNPNECGLESLTYWFSVLILAFQELCRSGYVAVNDIESHIEWIEFKKSQDMAEINLIKAEKPNGTTMLKLTPFEHFEYGSWYIQTVKAGELYGELVERRHESVRLSKIRSELLRKASQYLEEIEEVNPKLIGNKQIMELASLVMSLQR